MSLTWTKPRAGVERAMRGEVEIGRIASSVDGKYTWAITAVRMEHIGLKGHGTAMADTNARRALKQAWDKWLRKAGLAG